MGGGHPGDFVCLSSGFPGELSDHVTTDPVGDVGGETSGKLSPQTFDHYQN